MGFKSYVLFYLEILRVFEIYLNIKLIFKIICKFSVNDFFYYIRIFFLLCVLDVVILSKDF